jgi:hypothetical protein
MYIFVRQDLSQPQQIVQASHAAHEAGHDFGKAEGSTHIVLIGMPSQAKLLATADHLDTHNIPYKLFYEPDYDTGYTAIATQPLVGDQRVPLRKFRLMGA